METEIAKTATDLDLIQHDMVWALEDRVGDFEYLMPLLSCGHYGRPIFDASSQWDFPDDEHTCPECSKDVQWHPALQAAVYESWHGPAA
jgi:hypothetical protein